MRKVNKDFNKIPEKLGNCANENEAVLLTKKAKGIKQNCYKKAEPELLDLYYEKCAYCETKYLKNSDNWLEHYRPKSHYYWLAYEWSNLIPTCTKCNRIKKAKFPIIDEKYRVRLPTIKNGKLDKTKNFVNEPPLSSERPLLINPEIDDPIFFFNFEIDENKKGINIIGTDNGGRGEKTIEICGLNRTEGNYSGLPLHRQKEIIDALVEQLYLASELLYGNEIQQKYFITLISKIFKKLKQKAENPELEHTLLRKYIIHSENNFKSIVGQYLENQYLKKTVLQAFKIWKSSVETKIDN